MYSDRALEKSLPSWAGHDSSLSDQFSAASETGVLEFTQAWVKRAS